MADDRKTGRDLDDEADLMRGEDDMIGRGDDEEDFEDVEDDEESEEDEQDLSGAPDRG